VIDLISVTLTIIVILMIVGQWFVFLPLTFSYYFYFISSILSSAFALLVWLTLRFPALLEYSFLALVAFSLATFFIHHKTRERISSRGFEALITVFLFGLIIVLSNPIAIPITTFNSLFLGALVFFWDFSVITLNVLYRVKRLNQEFGIHDRYAKLRDYQEKLLNNYPENEARSTLDFILFYLRSSWEQFVQGDFESSFLNAYKIIFDNEFDELYVIPNMDKRRIPYSHIRAVLVHARGRDIRELDELKKIKHEIFNTTIDILRIVKTEFMDVIATPKK